jgi:hypothetical protein
MNAYIITKIPINNKIILILIAQFFDKYYLYFLDVINQSVYVLATG